MSSNPVPRLSVGMPVYNGERHLVESVESILGQSYRDFELIISDNASTDGTEAICRALAARDSRIRFHRQATNVGASDNYNTVFRLARGTYFKWASSNDSIAPGFLERCVALLDAEPSVVLACPKTRLVGIEGDPVCLESLDLRQERPVRRFRELLSRMRLNNVMNGVVRAEALRGTSLIKPYLASDVVLMAELALYGRIAEIPEPLFLRRMDPATATRLKSAEEVAQHYHPERRRGPQFSTWKAMRDFAVAGLRAPLGVAERVRYYVLLVRMMSWERGDLWSELRAVTR